MLDTLHTLRDKIARLEALPSFEQEAWEQVLQQVRAASCPAMLADAKQRMVRAWRRTGMPVKQGRNRLYEE